MNQSVRKGLAIMLCGLMFSVPALGETLKVCGLNLGHKGSIAYIETHPEVELQAVLSPYLSQTQLINDFISSGFPYDVFQIGTSSFDVQQLIKKGYCAPFTSSVITDAVAALHPAIAAQITGEDGIYGLPTYCSLNFMIIDKAGWDAAGLDQIQAPDTFPELLELLENWVKHLAQSEDGGVSVYGLFDEDLYGPGSYSTLLISHLVDEHIMQSSYAGLPLRFEGPELEKLLERCLEVGQALYNLDPGPEGRFSLFSTSSFMDDLGQLVSLRLREDQPKLIHANLSMLCIYAGSPHVLAAEEFTEACFFTLSDMDRAYLFRDAAAVPDLEREKWLKSMKEQIEETRKKAASENGIEQRDTEDEVARLEAALAKEDREENRYLLTSEDISRYQSYGSQLYFQPPSVFDPNTPEGQTVRGLVDQVAAGVLPVNIFMEQLNSMAIMLEGERSAT